MNTALSPSKLLIGVIAVAALLGGCKKTDVTAPAADTTMTTPATPAAPTSATDSTAQGSTAMPGANSTGSSGSSGSSGSGDAGSAGSANPAAPAAYPAADSATMPGTTTAPANDASKGAVRNNSGQTQGTAGSSLPTSDGSR